MTKEKTKLVVADEHTLGYIMPNSNVVGVLQASVLRGATTSLSPMPIYMFKIIRLATAKDFNDFRVCFNGYNNEKEYEFEK